MVVFFFVYYLCTQHGFIPCISGMNDSHIRVTCPLNVMSIEKLSETFRKPRDFSFNYKKV